MERNAYRPKKRINGKQIPMSHVVWYENTGKYPVEGEVIHHIDENPFNNEFENLQLMTRGEHIILHNTGKKRPYTSERNRKMSGKFHPFYGKKRPEHSAKMMGENNPRWKGEDVSDDAKRMRRLRVRRRESASV